MPRARTPTESSTSSPRADPPPACRPRRHRSAARARTRRSAQPCPGGAPRLVDRDRAAGLLQAHERHVLVTASKLPAATLKVSCQTPPPLRASAASRFHARHTGACVAEGLRAYASSASKERQYCTITPEPKEVCPEESVRRVRLELDEHLAHRHQQPADLGCDRGVVDRRADEEHDEVAVELRCPPTGLDLHAHTLPQSVGVVAGRSSTSPKCRGLSAGSRRVPSSQMPSQASARAGRAERRAQPAS